MTPFLQLILVLAIILFSAKFAGFLSTKLRQPAVLGELLVGLLLGPTLIDLTHMAVVTDTHLGEVVSELGELGVLVLMFLAGLELEMRDLTRSGKVSAFSGILGVLVPVGMGLLVGEIAGMDFSHAMFLGLTLGATSVSISAQTLMEMKMLRSRVGLGLLGAAVFDDILVILLLSGYLAIETGGSGLQLIIVLGKMIIFLLLSVAFGLWILPAITRVISRLPISQGVLTLAIIILLVYGLAAELVGGMAAITGTFLAGMMFGRTPEKGKIEEGLRALAYAFFVPIFFVNIGLSVDLHAINLTVLWLFLGISAVAILGKIIGAGVGARIGGFTWRESLQMGIGMVSRGEVGLIVAKVGLDQGLLNNNIFSAIVGMVLVTTLVTPPMLRASFSKSQPHPTKPVIMETKEPESMSDQEAV